MATTTLIRLTKPRISALILEATGTAVSVILVLWLLLWFIFQRVPVDRVEAFYVAADDVGVPSEEVPFQAADVRRLRGSQQSAETRKTEPRELVAEIRKKINDRLLRPVVIYVSAPVLGTGTSQTGERIQELVKTVAAESKRDVVLAVDLAQIDTDRDVGVFANSPHSHVQETIDVLGKPANSIFVITSAAAAQRSWTADGLGQSIFAYYLREGLEGKATGWDDKDPEWITVEGLYRYVFHHVRRWARLRRHSEQTPELLRVLAAKDKPQTVRIRRVRNRNSAPSRTSEIADRESAAAAASVAQKTATPGKPEPAAEEHRAQDATTETKPDTLDSQVDVLISEWKAHDDLAKERPYRKFPGAWRFYEAALLRAERRLRAASKEPAIWKQRFDETLKSAKERGSQLKKDVQNGKTNDFPFQPVADDPQGRQQLAEAILRLTGKLPAWLGPSPVTVSEAKPGSVKAPANPGENNAGATAATPPPSSFIVPRTEAHVPFLEMQLPRWAYDFTRDFKCDEYFRDSHRAELLNRLVQLRGDAERALSTDHRGLRWIRPLIKDGDRERRLIQDKLFGMSRNVLDLETETRIESGVKRAYDSALGAIKAFHEARDTWEQAASEFPYLAEWEIRREAVAGHDNGQVLGVKPLPAPVDLALNALAELTRALGAPLGEREGRGDTSVASDENPLQQLNVARKGVDDALRALKGGFELTTESYGTVSTPGWVELDAVLRVPLIPSERRKALLQKVLEVDDAIADIGPEEKTSTEMEAISPPDRGFWIRGAGLAGLDLALRNLVSGASDESDREPGEILRAWEIICPSPADGGMAKQALPHFTSIHKRLELLRAKAGKGLIEQPKAEPRGMSEAENELRARDGKVRCFSPREVEQFLSGIDRTVRDYDAVADCACLDFHLARLRDDYLEDDGLHFLEKEIDRRKTPLGITTSAPGGAAHEGLRVRVTPDQKRDIDEDWKSDFRVIVEYSPDLPRGRRAIPNGDAFVGLIGGAAGLTINNNEPVGRDVPGAWIHVPLDQPMPPNLPFTIAQTDNVKLLPNSERLDLVARIFYRGRSDLAEPCTIAIKPKEVGERVAIRISQDQNKLRIKYPRAGPIPDQFRRHEKEGFMHKGKDLDYVIEIENKTPRPLTVTCRRYMVDEVTGQKTEIQIRPPIVNQILDPGKPISFEGEVRSSAASNGRPQRLSVEVSEPEMAIPPYVVTFREISWKEYMVIDRGKDNNFKHEKNGVVIEEPCFVVTMRRLKEDPVTEPIPAEEIKCEFSAANQDLRMVSGKESPDRWLWPDRLIQFYQPLHDLKMPIKWRAHIETQVLDQEVEP